MSYLIAGNWKMNGLRASLEQVSILAALLEGRDFDAEVLICPPVTLLERLFDMTNGTMIKAGAQDCHFADTGAHTGEISAEMLKESGAEFVIVGHSERRTDHGETDALVRAKAEAVQRAGMVPIICVGETKEEREDGKALEIVTAQLAGSVPDGGDYVIAYEPVWAIGTGLVPTLDDISEMHRAIRGNTAASTKILYGGSVKPTNASEILAIKDVNGALVGGASLTAEDFFGIISEVK